MFAATDKCPVSKELHVDTRMKLAPGTCKSLTCNNTLTYDRQVAAVYSTANGYFFMLMVWSETGKHLH